ncbi:MAG TPA: hypothetical protein VK184_17925 [Nostocaceae cyanobacterium]|nr:hypothetical protein [Nostocaceae cyanobacterium]
MNLRAIALAAILGVSAPAIFDVAVNHQAVAATFDYPEGQFVDKDWRISLTVVDNDYTFYAQSRHVGDNRFDDLSLTGAIASGTKQRQIYTWNNNGTKYIVSWRPSDPRFIRVRVIRPNGRVIINKLYESAH